MKRCPKFGKQRPVKGGRCVLLLFYVRLTDYLAKVVVLLAKKVSELRSAHVDLK